MGPAPDTPYPEDRCLYRFRFIRDYSGGRITNFGDHSIDIAQWGLGTDATGPVEVEHRSATICHLGNIAIDLRAKLRWDPERETFTDPRSDAANRLLDRPRHGEWRSWRRGLSKKYNRPAPIGLADVETVEPSGEINRHD